MSAQEVQILTFEQFQWLMTYVVGGYAALGSTIVILFWLLIRSKEKEAQIYETVYPVLDKVSSMISKIKNDNTLSVDLKKD